jgi:hypothetical protein
MTQRGFEIGNSTMEVIECEVKISDWITERIESESKITYSCRKMIECECKRIDFAAEMMPCKFEMIDLIMELIECEPAIIELIMKMIDCEFEIINHARRHMSVELGIDNLVGHLLLSHDFPTFHSGTSQRPIPTSCVVPSGSAGVSSATPTFGLWTPGVSPVSQNLELYQVPLRWVDETVRACGEFHEALSIESENEIFSIENNFLIDNVHHKLICNFSNSSNITIPASIQIVGSNCF